MLVSGSPVREARHGTLILPSLPAALHTQINNCTEATEGFRCDSFVKSSASRASHGRSASLHQQAAECCRLVSGMVALMTNQRDRLPQASASCFTLVVHLVCRLLPMPLPLDDDYWPDKCFWAGQPLTLETKRDLLRSLHLISRYFSASAENLRATRETDGARTCVAAALVVMMDALLRRPIDLLDKQVAVQERHGDLISLHYSGAAGGHQSPCKPFLLDPSTFRETSEALLLPQPELALLRAQVLDYFQSLTTLATSSSRGSMNAKRLFRQLTRVKEAQLQEHETQYLFTFEKGMALGPADRLEPSRACLRIQRFRALLGGRSRCSGLFVEQLGLSIGLESAGSSASPCSIQMFGHIRRLVWQTRSRIGLSFCILSSAGIFFSVESSPSCWTSIRSWLGSVTCLASQSIYALLGLEHNIVLRMKEASLLIYSSLGCHLQAVFLWKVLLLPPADDESDKAPRRKPNAFSTFRRSSIFLRGRGSTRRHLGGSRCTPGLALAEGEEIGRNRRTRGLRRARLRGRAAKHAELQRLGRQLTSTIIIDQRKSLRSPSPLPLSF